MKPACSSRSSNSRRWPALPACRCTPTRRKPSAKCRSIFAGLGVAAMSCAAHKFHGPRGIGALLLRGDVPLEPLHWGGFHQEGLRPGTECVALAVGMHVALASFQREQAARCERIARLRDRFEAAIRGGWPNIVIHGDESTDRCCGRAASRYIEHLVSGPRPAGAVDGVGHGGRGLLDRLGLRQRLARTVADAVGDGPARARWCKAVCDSASAQRRPRRKSTMRVRARFWAFCEPPPRGIDRPRRDRFACGHDAVAARFSYPALRQGFAATNLGRKNRLHSSRKGWKIAIIPGFNFCSHAVRSGPQICRTEPRWKTAFLQSRSRPIWRSPKSMRRTPIRPTAPWQQAHRCRRQCNRPLRSFTTTRIHRRPGKSAWPAVAIESLLQERPSRYNPLVILGSPGTGKTHLARGLAECWAARHSHAAQRRSSISPHPISRTI